MTDTREKLKLLRKAWKRPKEDFTSISMEEPDIGAIQALHRGDATPDQQKRALDWIIMKACGFYELSFSESQRETDFSEGRRFVGKQIVNMLALNLSIMRRNEK